MKILMIGSVLTTTIVAGLSVPHAEYYLYFVAAACLSYAILIKRRA